MYCPRSLCFWSALALAFLLPLGCSRAPAPPAAAPAEKPKVEGDLAYVTLSPEAVKSLQVESRPVRTEPVQEHLTLTGWIMAPQGSEVTVTAPVAGHVCAANGSAPPVAGREVGAGDELFTLEPVLSPVEQIQIAALRRDVDAEFTKAQITLKVADSELKRMTDLHRQGLRPQQDLEKAQERYDHAVEGVKAARDKQKLFARQAVTVRAPRAGTVLTVHVSPGQYVPAAAPLVTIADLSRLWVRVPVPEHDLPAVNPREPVRLALRGNGGASGMVLAARPVALVPQVDTQRHTADMIYEITPAQGQALYLSPGAGALGAALTAAALSAPPPALAKDQMVSVFVPLSRKQRECVVPYSAVVYDSFGNTWIYLDRTKAGAARHAYERRRVQLGPGLAAEVVIRPPLLPGERVVTNGAAALFSREFHSTPVRDQDDDD